MQLDPVDAVDAVILAPAVGGAVRAAADEAVQHGQERRALQRELMVARAGQALDHGPAAGLLPHPLEGERRTDAARRDRRRLAAVERVEHDRLVGEARPRAQKPLQLPALLQILDPPERGDNLLAHRRALAPALDDLQVGAAARGLFFGNTWRKAWRRLDDGAHRIRQDSRTIKQNRRKTWHYILAAVHPRPQSNQRLTPGGGAPTVEDQSESLVPNEIARQFPARPLALCAMAGQHSCSGSRGASSGGVEILRRSTTTGSAQRALSLSRSSAR